MKRFVYWMLLITWGVLTSMFMVMMMLTTKRSQRLSYEQQEMTITPLQSYVDHVELFSNLFDCKELLANNSGQKQQEAIDYLKNNTKNLAEDIYPDSMFPYITRNCRDFVRHRGYLRQASQDVTEIPVAYTILTYRNTEEVERLLNMIYHSNNVYCIHVDKKSPEAFYKAVRSITSCFPNVFLTTRRENIVYEHISRLRAELNCIEDLLAKDTTWRYYVNLASSEIPLKTSTQLVSILKVLKDKNDIREVYGNRRHDRFTHKHFINNGKMKRSKITLPPVPYNLTITKGLAYGAFTREFLKFTLTNKIARKFLVWCKDTHSPDEHYWATLNNLYHNPFLKSPGGSIVHPDRTPYISRHIYWKSNQQKNKCHGTYRHNICVFGIKDLPTLDKSNKIIANKFDLERDPITYSCMEERLRRKR